MTSAANAVERDNSTRPRKLSLLECQTYCKADIQQMVECHNQHAGGDPYIHDEFNSMDDEKVMEELEKLEKTAAKAAAKSSQGKKVWTSIAALRADLPHVADAVTMLMARNRRRGRHGAATGATDLQINLYGDDDDDSAIHYYVHLDPIRSGESVLRWSINTCASFHYNKLNNKNTSNLKIQSLAKPRACTCVQSL